MIEQLWTSPRKRTALFLFPPELCGNQEELASNFSNCTVIDWLSNTLKKADDLQRFVNTNVDIEIDNIRQKADSERKVFCFINNEYFLARFDGEERKLFWQSLWKNFPHLNGIVVFFVLNSPEILPNNLDLESWKEEDRLFSYKEK